MARTYKKIYRKRKGMRNVWRGGQHRSQYPVAAQIRERDSAMRRQMQRLGAKAGFGSVLSPFPPTLFTVFSYSETFNLAQAVAGVPVIRTYRANGIFDPSQTGVGIQPRYYDSLIGANNGTAPYQRYRVHASKISATVWPTSASAAAGNLLVSVIPRRSTVTSPSTIDEQRERPYGKHVPLTQTASYKPRKVRNYAKMKIHLSHKDLRDIDAASAQYNAVPTEEVYWDICQCDVASTTVSTTTIQVTIKYFVELYTLNDVADS